MIEVEQSANSDQIAQLDPETKASMLLDILEIVVGDALKQGKDIPLAELQEIKFSFADDGSVKLALVSAGAEGPVEDLVEVSPEVVMSALEEAVIDMELETVDA